MNQVTPLLTIAVPTYNGSRTIGNMLDILLPQVTEEVEVIISDNCSTDNTKSIIEAYQKQFKVHYVRNEKNIGPDANFLQCMRLANGKFTYLISDDDILIEGALSKILDFLKKYPDVSLVYLDSVGFKDKYTNVQDCHYYREKCKPVVENICTSDRKTFMNYAIRMWGFVSSYLWATEKFKAIEEPERFFNTYWLQSYVHIGCVTNENDLLGVVKGPCIAAGEYRGVNNFSTAEVDGIYYKKMLDYAVEKGFFDEKQLNDFYLWRVCFLGKIAAIKEREAGIHKTSKKQLFQLTYKHPYAWIHMYPYFFVPKWLIVLRKKILGTGSNDSVKRATD